MALGPAKQALDFKTVTFSNASALTINGNSGGNTVLSTSDDITGYTPTGIIEFNGGKGSFAFVAFVFSSKKIYLYNVKSSSDTAAIGDINVKVTYMKN